ncbi:DUF3157 family protein [Mariniflexile sp. AS56]|uniref:DUF3157 family protein n=1 Tax=Mariniflexile sp. AS56 TaxID=3063957 RepID=UPI0026EDA160|nr:DUF3157 family protein [Mariniflexile sp. AS56]MDO7171079.1 DUF3157 family protein [Mariniflexile sp. AS56]
MKKCLFILLFFISYIGFSQNNHIVNTEDGRRVWLKADYTWEYVDDEKPEAASNNRCNLAENFVEPSLNSKIQSQLKKGRATMNDVKKKVAKDYDCEVGDVTLITVTEQKAKGVYHFCANGSKVTYKRNGHAIIESGKFF